MSTQAHLRNMLATFAIAGWVLAAAPAQAQVEASLDLRLVDSDGRDSYMDGGFGKLRYDADDDAVQLARARLAWRGNVLGNWHASIDLSAWSLNDHHAIDITEGWLEWRPVPTSPWRSNLKIGAFYAPISLEHRAPGWSNPYTISSSALNTWVGEELRTIGAGYELEHLGIANGGRFDYGVNAAVFGWNDPAGVIIALRGFSLNDRQTPLFGRIGTYNFGRREQRVIFSEIDGRAGFHVGGYLKSDTGLELRALRYDNRGDPAAEKQSIEDYAWDTRFNTLGARYDGPGGLALIAQWMQGLTDVMPGAASSWRFETWFVLASRQFGAHRLAARYDDFSTRQRRSGFPGALGVNDGTAVTLGWSWSLGEHVELAGEWLRLHSDYNKRAALGETPHAVEHSLQLALRLTL